MQGDNTRHPPAQAELNPHSHRPAPSRSPEDVREGPARVLGLSPHCTAMNDGTGCSQWKRFAGISGV